MYGIDFGVQGHGHYATHTSYTGYSKEYGRKYIVHCMLDELIVQMSIDWLCATNCNRYSIVNWIVT
jgi:hypothetical protein